MYSPPGAEDVPVVILASPCLFLQKTWIGPVLMSCTAVETYCQSMLVSRCECTCVHLTYLNTNFGLEAPGVVRSRAGRCSARVSRTIPSQVEQRWTEILL